MIRAGEFTLKDIAGYYHLSYSRVRGIIKSLGIEPKRREGNQPVFSTASVLKFEKRNTKPGPRKNGAKK